MMSGSATIYQDMAERTGGDIYIGVVGPVRTGKSTFVKRVMETMVIPNIENIYQKERAKDELPQSGSGKTIMTSEPKFVPEDAVEISPDEAAKFRIRMIDSVGYMIPGVVGAEEDGQPRMITTPWADTPLSMSDAAEIGTKKIMEDHCTMGIVMTTDGSVTDIGREDYIEAEEKAIKDMQATGKPFVVLVNSKDPNGTQAQAICRNIENTYDVPCQCIDALTMEEEGIRQVLTDVLYEFPVAEIDMYLPGWVEALPHDHSLKKLLYEAILQCAGQIKTLRQAEPLLSGLQNMEDIERVNLQNMDGGSGLVSCELRLPDSLFYEVLSQYAGIPIDNDSQLMTLLSDLAQTKKSYEKVSAALQQVWATGYGIVMPSPEEMTLEVPEIVRKGSNFGVRLKASAPSIHMLRADIETEISPMVGDEKQSEDLLAYLQKEYHDAPEKLWQSNIFGKSVYELVNEGLGTKLKRMPEESQYKLQSTLSRIINEGSSGLLCIILA